MIFLEIFPFKSFECANNISIHRYVYVFFYYRACEKNIGVVSSKSSHVTDKDI